MTTATAPTTPDPTPAIIEFLRTMSGAAADLAEALENQHLLTPSASLDTVYLGPFQRQLAEIEAMTTEGGIKPGEICKILGRMDEPNVRNALTGMRARGIAETVPGVTPQHWRLTQRFRQS